MLLVSGWHELLVLKKKEVKKFQLKTSMAKMTVQVAITEKRRKVNSMWSENYCQGQSSQTVGVFSLQYSVCTKPSIRWLLFQTESTESCRTTFEYSPFIVFTRGKNQNDRCLLLVSSIKFLSPSSQVLNCTKSNLHPYFAWNVIFF